MVTEKQKANLRPLNTRPKSEQREIQRKGTQKSAEVRREVKTMKEALLEVLTPDKRAELAEAMIKNGMSGNSAMLMMALKLVGENPDADSVMNHNIVVQIPSEMDEYGD